MAITKATASAVAPAAKGDLVVGSATNDAAVLGVGTDGQYLTAASTTATGLQWSTLSAGGMTSIASGSIAASLTGFDLQNISQDYNDLILYLRNYSTVANAQLRMRLNNNSSGVYNWINYGTNSTGGAASSGNSEFRLSSWDIAPTQAGQSGWVYFPDYKSTSTYKLMHYANTSDNSALNFGYLFTTDTSAISRITLYLNGSTFDSGTYQLFGVK